MHEHALMCDVVGRVVQLAEAEGATGVTRVIVRLGALSHFTPEHFTRHYEDAARGTIAEGAVVDAVVHGTATDTSAQGVVVESVEVEYPGEEEIA
jgi:hydrogenase nickel incorporation protein HypA/HybF